jgi:hypothetical protein
MSGGDWIDDHGSNSTPGSSRHSEASRGEALLPLAVAVDLLGQPDDNILHLAHGGTEVIDVGAGICGAAFWRLRLCRIRTMSSSTLIDVPRFRLRSRAVGGHDGRSSCSRAHARVVADAGASR